MKKKIVAVLLTALSMPVWAQNQEDIFRYSYQGISGTPRSLGLAGAWGAVGADFASASINPAGLGFYRRGEMMGSLGITSNLSSTTYLGNNLTDSRTKLLIPNLGIVFAKVNQDKGKDATEGVTGMALAFGMNRINDFQSNVQFSGKAYNTTVGDYMARMANGTDSSNLFDSKYDNVLFAQAWRLRLIDNMGGTASYGSILNVNGDTNYAVRQSEQIQSRGGMNEWYASGALNFSNTVYIGASLVYQSVNYSNKTIYKEEVIQTSLPYNPYKNSTIVQSLETNGGGIGGKFGLIVRPLDVIRLGVSYQTPVRMNLKDYYQNSTTITYGGKSYNEPGTEDNYSYQIVTPGRLTASGALFFGKKLLISADYEQVDYRNGRLVDKLGQADYSQANDLNKQIYAKADNYRIGLEYNLGFTRWRVGYAQLGNPYNDQLVSKDKGTKHIISAGFGWVYDNTYYFNISAYDRIGNEDYTAYDGVPTSAVNKSNKLNFAFGAGYKF